MTETVIPFDELQDPYGIQFWPEFKGRDGCRTPMVWNHNAASGGFTEGKPWLRIAPEHLQLAVDRNTSEENSLLAHYRAALRLRSRYRELVKGGIRFIGAHAGVLTFERQLGGATMFVALNMSEEMFEIEGPSPDYSEVDSPGIMGQLVDGKIVMPPYGSYFSRRVATSENAS